MYILEHKFLKKWILIKLSLKISSYYNLISKQKYPTLKNKHQITTLNKNINIKIKLNIPHVNWNKNYLFFLNFKTILNNFHNNRLNFFVNSYSIIASCKNYQPGYGINVGLNKWLVGMAMGELPPLKPACAACSACNGWGEGIREGGIKKLVGVRPPVTGDSASICIG